MLAPSPASARQAASLTPRDSSALVNAWIRVHSQTHIYTLTHSRTYTYSYMCIPTLTHLCTDQHIRIYDRSAHTHTHTHTRTHTHTHTHTHTDTNSSVNSSFIGKIPLKLSSAPQTEGNTELHHRVCSKKGISIMGGEGRGGDRVGQVLFRETVALSVRAGHW